MNDEFKIIAEDILAAGYTFTRAAEIIGHGCTQPMLSELKSGKRLMPLYHPGAEIVAFHKRHVLPKLKRRDKL